ncbi:MAG: CoA transferase [Pseudomonadales bacterium]
MKVIEIGGGVAAGYTTKLLADTGATVVKLELPAGDAVRATPGLFSALNVNKDSICLNYAADPAQLRPWLAWADVLVHSLDAEQATLYDLTADALTNAYPGLVTCAVTPFGQTGPYAHYAATELILSNAGGWANLCPATHQDPELPPLKVYGDQCQLMAAISAAATTLACARHASRSGVGEHIDFAIQAYVASVLEAAIPAFSYKEEVINRSHPRSLIPWRIFQAKDAPVFIVCIEQDQWQRLVHFMGDPEWASLPTFADQPARQENQDLVHTLVQEFVSDWTAQDLYHAAQAERICVAPVMDLAQLAASEHLAARDFFVDFADTCFMAPAVLGNQGRARLRSAAPALGSADADTYLQQTDSHVSATPDADAPVATNNVSAAPLAGVRVLDMTWAWAGPFCSLNLAHLGAEVIRIESAMRPDLYRRLPIYPVGVEEGLNCSGMFNQWNQGKASVTVNLSDPAGIELVKAMVREVDVVVQNFATGVMDRLGLGYDTLKAINPGIILASISGYGQSGPYKNYMGYGPAIPPLTGLSAATGYVGGEAEEFGLSMPDPTAGITAAYGIMAALIKRDHSGVGDHLDVSLWEATAVLNAEGWMNYQTSGQQPTRQGNRHPDMVPHGVFRCRGDDSWLAIACQDDAAWGRLAELMSVEEPRWASLAGRLASIDELEALITQWSRDQDRWALCELLQANGIAAFPTMSTADIVNDPHLAQRGFIERLAHPEVGVRAHTGIPWRLTRGHNGVRAPAPCIDQDTDRYLEDLLGLDTTEIKTLREQGIIGC